MLKLLKLFVGLAVSGNPFIENYKSMPGFGPPGHSGDLGIIINVAFHVIH